MTINLKLEKKLDKNIDLTYSYFRKAIYDIYSKINPLLQLHQDLRKSTKMLLKSFYNQTVT